jgi:hypothetical protein
MHGAFRDSNRTTSVPNIQLILKENYNLTQILSVAGDTFQRTFPAFTGTTVALKFVLVFFIRSN